MTTDADIAYLSAREALERLPSELDGTRGGVRIHARFHNGKLIAPTRVLVFRVPPGELGRRSIAASLGVKKERPPTRPPLWLELLEHAASQLELAEGDTELIAEYTAQDGRLALHWVDFAWDETVGISWHRRGVQEEPP